MMQRPESAQKFIGSFCFADTSGLYLSCLCSMLGLQGELMEWYRGKSAGLTARGSGPLSICCVNLGFLFTPSEPRIADMKET